MRRLVNSMLLVTLALCNISCQTMGVALPRAVPAECRALPTAIRATDIETVDGEWYGRVNLTALDHLLIDLQMCLEML